MEKTATAHWKGPIQNGQGLISVQSGIFKNAPYSFATRFENHNGTNPEELIAAAHAACFAMALSTNLSKEGWEVLSINSSAAVSVDRVAGEWTITDSKLIVEAEIPGIDDKKFQQLAEEAKDHCPVSRMLNASISLTARLQPVSAETSAKIGH
jgi:osmotically inducible protein OsmC